MRDFNVGLLSALIATLALCGCDTLDHRQEAANTGMATAHDVTPDETVSSPGKNEKTSQPMMSADGHLSLNLHVFGLAYHPDREGTRLSHLDNELNFGFGLGYKLHEDAVGVLNSEAGLFKDSGSNWAKFAGVGYQLKVFQNWLLGVDVLAIQSHTYNSGNSFVAPIPRLTYDFGAFKVNMVYIPKYKEFNRFAAYGLFITIPLWK